jgi:hypothetical protein
MEILTVMRCLKSKSKPHFTANLDITEFAFKKIRLATSKFKIDNAIANTLNTDIKITGQDNQADLKEHTKLIVVI